jgi:DNA topoisomerase-2
MSEKRDYYEVLGLSKNANEADIKNAEDLLKVYDVINKTVINDLIPHYPNYKGSIKIKDGKENIYESTGCFHYIDDNTIEITEIPLNKAIEDYKAMLEDLVLNNQIKNFENHYSALNIRFVVYLNNKVEDPIKFFKLSSTVGLSLNNMHLYNSDIKIKKYDSTSAIMREWCSVRLTCYHERKTHQLNVLNKLFKKLSAKAQFIQDIIDGKIKIMNVEDSSLIARLEELKYPKLSDKDDDNEESEEVDTTKNYNYLLRMPVNSLTKNNLEKLKKNAEEVNKQIKELTKTPIYKIWLKELNEVKAGYQLYKNELAEIYENDLLSLQGNSTKKVVKKKK